MNTELVIKENDLELVITEKLLGSLTTNAKQIRDTVQERLPMFDISNYSEDNIDKAKLDKASLNKASKALNDKRIEIEKEFMKPFAEFKEVINETVKLISECSSKIDSVVKQSDLAYKDSKKKAIRDYFNGRNTYSVDFNKVFKESWLNKTVKEKNALVDLDQILSSIEKDIQTLESMPEDFNVLKTFYLDSLDINSTIQYANRLREQRERTKQVEEAKSKAEETINKPEPQSSSISFNAFANPSIPPAQSELSNTAVDKESELLTRAFKVTATRENIIALGDFMNERGIKFEKIEL